jgi:CRISPR-associated endonuclease/helicase Cas3
MSNPGGVDAEFERDFEQLTGHSPFPWQVDLFQHFIAGRVPEACDIPTGLGKTSVIAIWLLARERNLALPRRLVYVVNRRTVVDQTTSEVERLASTYTGELAVSTLRGQLADNREWSADPSRQAVICGTVDMIGSRLLFCGYGLGFKQRPIHAGFLGQDALLVHDEAHLEPAFQSLVEEIVREQARCGDPWPLKLMQLTATPRDPTTALRISDEDRRHPVVFKRIHAKKRMHLHEFDGKGLPDLVVQKVLELREAKAPVLVFLRSVDDVLRVIKRLRQKKVSCDQLTGTLRGHERDKLLETKVFRHFMPDRGGDEFAVLVCTSAGEVGVNISADHMVCDLSTFDSMAQRLGRLNRFGLTESAVHIFVPTDLDEEKPIEKRLLRTVDLLVRLNGDASPAALSALPIEERVSAFSPAPRLLPATDILFDAWAMTSVRTPMAGRPPVEAYLHGVIEDELARTTIAWRDEVDLIDQMLWDSELARDLLDDYPLKPHETLSDQSKRVANILQSAQEHGKDSPLWIVRDTEIERINLSALLRSVRHDKGKLAQRIANCTLLLSPKLWPPICGQLSESLVSQVAESESASQGDIADLWTIPDEKKREPPVPGRHRTFNEESRPAGMRLIRRVILKEDEEDPNNSRVWSWFEHPRGGDGDGSRAAREAVLLSVHSADVEDRARAIAQSLDLSETQRVAIAFAGKHHDDGKSRRIWQRGIGNHHSTFIYAKSGPRMTPLDASRYRHELGSVLDFLEKNSSLQPEMRELCLHLIAAHHGRARPHFPIDELFDPEHRGTDFKRLGLQIQQRFARLQRRYGRWGLAYLESLVRAADYLASSAPSRISEYPPRESP